MSQIPEKGLIVQISVSPTLFHPKQTRKGAQCSKYRNCPLRITDGLALHLLGREPICKVLNLDSEVVGSPFKCHCYGCNALIKR